MPNFENWLNSPNNSYHLDKDIKQQNVPINYKVYSPETCELIPTQENLAQTIKDRFADNEYNSYQTFLNNGGKQVMRAKFTDPLSAAVYRECYAHYKYGMPMINDATKVPITMEAFSQAQSNRVIYGEPYPYKRMFEIVDNTEPFDPNKFGYKKLLESSQMQ